MPNSYDCIDEDDYPRICKHGHEAGDCNTCDEETGDIDKCMNCGRYKASDSLTYPDQVCKGGCVNPNEY